MTLIQRLRLILLPIILLVFTITGGLVYKTVYQRHLDSEYQRLSTILDYFYKDYQLELVSAQSALDLVLSGTELADYLYQIEIGSSAHAVNEVLDSQLSLLQQRIPGAHSLQIVDLLNDKTFSAGDDDLFEALSRSPLQTHTDDSYLVTDNRDNRLHEQHIVYSLDGDLLLGMIRWFSPELHSVSSPTHSNATYRARYDANALSYQHLLETMSDNYQHGFAITLKPSLPGSDNITHIVGAFELGGDLFVRKVTEFFTIEVTVDEHNINAALSDLRWQLFALSLVLTVGSYVAIWSGIRHQVISPIRRLVKSLQDPSDTPKLARLSGVSEVASLNNAYVDLVERVRHISAYDRLTELGNRRSFDQCLELEMERAKANKTTLAVLYIDLDNFKRVNEHFGHQQGDELLSQFSQQLLSFVCTRHAITAAQGLRIVDYVARLAGDEFGIILNNVPDAAAAEAVALEINHHFSQGIEIDNKVLDVCVSIGVAVYPEVAQSQQELVVYSDEAKLQAKRRGKNQVQVFTKEIADGLELRKFMETELLKSYHDDQFELVFQPMYHSTSLQIVCYEVLLRCPLLAIHGIGPDKFIPIAEATGMIRLIDLWVLENAFKAQRRLIARGYRGKAAINISAVELSNPQFPSQLERLLEQYQIDPETIELEITETSLVDNTEKTAAILWEIKSTGVNLALDDFGTGYTGLSQLAKYPIDTLKIDRSFITNLTPDKRGQQSTFNMIVQLAEMYQIDTVAEGVETETEFMVTSQQCTYLQGYYLSKPLSLAGLIEQIEAPIAVQISNC